MPALGSRLKALETRMAPPSGPKRVYMVAGSGTDEEMAAFLQADGWAFDADTDMIIHLVPMQPDFRDGRVHGPIPCEDEVLNQLRLCRPASPAWRLDAA